MYIVSERTSNKIISDESKKRIIDGIETIINLNEADFYEFIEMLTIEPNKKKDSTIYFFYTADKKRYPEKAERCGVLKENDRGYIGGKVCTIPEFISQVEEYITDLKQNTNIFSRLSIQLSNKNSRCEKIISTRSMEALKRYYSEGNDENYKLVGKLFEILTNSNSSERFMNFEENKELFKINDKEYQIQDYLKMFGKVFRYRDESRGEKKASFLGECLIEKYNIPQEIKSTIYQNATQIYKTYHDKYDRFIDSRYEFRDLYEKKDSRIIRKGEEPDWNVNETLKTAVFKDMPENLNLEEKALFIYFKLCQVLEYNEEYLYKDKDISAKFENSFSKQRLESIKPGSKILCFDFARIFSKLVNELNGDIEAVTIVQGINEEHFLTGFYTDKVSVRLEPMNINLNSTIDPTNDLTKAKNGLKLRGVQPIFDRENIISDSLRKVYSIVYEKDATSINDLVNELKSIQKIDVPQDIETKLKSFIEVMVEKRIVGSEFAQTLEGMYKNNFFGKDLERRYLGERIEQDEKKSIQRWVLIWQKGKKEDENTPFYLINTSTLEIVPTTYQILNEKINAGNLIYENARDEKLGIGRND